jgi:hypothetical protein
VVHWRAEYTDRLYVLLGASIPFVLRPEGDHFKIVGETYVRDFMYARAIDMMRRGELELQTIDII